MARTLENFKAAYNVDKLDFNMNPKTNRAIASFFSKDNVEIKVVTKPLSEFDPQKPIYVYNCIDTDSGEIVGDTFILSNKAGATPAFSL